MKRRFGLGQVHYTYTHIGCNTPYAKETKVGDQQG